MAVRPRLYSRTLSRQKPGMIVLLRCRNCNHDSGILPPPPTAMRGLVHCMHCGSPDVRMYALPDADDDRFGRGDRYELVYVRPGRTRKRKKKVRASGLSPAAAAVLRMADACATCSHRRDVHVDETGRCVHVSAKSDAAGVVERCGCTRFTTTKPGRRKKGA